MSSNPYEAPRTDIVGVNSGRAADLRLVAQYQKGVLTCILLQIGAVIANLALPPELRFFVALGTLVVALAGTVFVFLLAMKVYSPAMGVLLGVLTLVPCVGLIVLLVVNGKATSVLQANGVKVGLLGAKSMPT